jgi:RNA polymerase sigma-54 factor
LLAKQDADHIFGLMAGMEQLQGLHLQQTLSPQMQQSLHILQAPLQELRQMIAQELRENPVLEEFTAPDGMEVEPEPPARSEMEEAWEPYYEQQRLSSPADAAEKHQFLLDSLTREPSLPEAVREQLTMVDWTREDRKIADAITGNLGDNGFLEAREEEIAFQTGVTPLRVEEVLQRVQDLLEPPGLAARDLRDCLLIQLRRRGLADSLEARLVKSHLEEVARRRYTELARKLKVGREEISTAVARLAQLDPAPARQFSPEPEVEVIPEIIVEREGEDFTIRLNRSDLPAIRLGSNYKDLLSTTGPAAAETRAYLREKIRSGRFFLRSIEQRQETMLAIGREIVQRQRDFMSGGPGHLHPMTMHTVAEAVGVHETTVSRAVSGKYMETPFGIFEMKFFFTSGYTTQDGEEISNESVRRALQTLVATENSAKPLSDEQIVNVLKAQGITVARRTIAKYRDQLGILPSHLRKAAGVRG